MGYNPDIHHRRSIRLQGYDYAQAGAYFITICTKNRECLFGEIVDGGVRLNDAGIMVNKCWDDIPKHFPNVILDEFIVMPNHVHGIIFISESVGANNYSPLPPATIPAKNGTSKTIGSIIRGLKIGVTKWFREKSSGIVLWQRNYYEHVIRNDGDLHRIRQYIICNPENWQSDENNPAAVNSVSHNLITSSGGVK